MKKHKNRMHIKALKNTIKKNELIKRANEANLREIFYHEEYEKNKFKNYLQAACDCIVSELDSNDALRAIFMKAEIIKYNGPDYMRVIAKEKVNFKRCLSEEITPEKNGLCFHS